MYSEPVRHICCPTCGAREGYQLGDGRKKCRRCGKKYTRRPLHSRLAAKSLKRIALYFWLAAPVATVARDLGLDPKTVRRHYTLIQQGISRCEHLRCQLPEESTDRKEGLTLLVSPERIWVEIAPLTFPTRVTDSSTDYLWWYSQRMRFGSFPVETTCLVFLAAGAIHLQRDQWLYDLEKLEKIIQAICHRKRCRTSMTHRQLMTEAVFRFNHRNNPGVTAILYGFMKNLPI